VLLSSRLAQEGLIVDQETANLAVKQLKPFRIGQRTCPFR
jgi:hypothetical protein